MYEMDQYTVSLLHFDGGLTDESGKVWTANGGATISATQIKFGEGSLYLNGSSQYLTTSNSSDFDFGSDDFTIDWWEYRTSLSEAECVYNRNIATTTYAPIKVGHALSNGQIGVAMSSTGSNADIASVSMGAAILNAWTHYAVARNGNNFYAFQNGILQNTWISTLSIASCSNGPAIGKNADKYFHGYIDEFRISKGIARWTSNFAVIAPTNLTATAGNSQVILSWDVVTGATGYIVKRSTTVGGPYLTIATNVTGTSYIDNTVTNGTTYYYVVTAVDGSSNESANSNEASATPIVSAPINLIAIAGNSQVTLSWGSVSTATGYNVKRSTTASGPYAIIASNVTVNNYVDSAVINGTTYYYVVTALSGNSESTNSNEASATPQGHGLLRITMNDSSEREYKLLASEIDDFVKWFNRTIGTGTTGYVFNKAVQNSKEYLSFEKIISFEVIPLTE
jgi:hypothetical protein